MTVPPVICSVDAALHLRDQASIGFSIRRIPLSQAEGWSLADGALSHRSGGFFNIVGAASHGHPETRGIYIFQPAQALNGLLVAIIDGTPHLLLQICAEPGNLGAAQFRPTIQATPGNYMRLHGGTAPSYIDHVLSYHPGAVPFADSSHPDLGERYFMKNKRLVFVQVAEPPPAEEGFAWVPFPVVCRMARLSAVLNMDLRSMVALMPWTCLPASTPGNALAAALRAGLDKPLRPGVVGQVMTELARQAAIAPTLDHMIPLSELDGWDITGDAIRERSGRCGFEVNFFEITAPGREVRHWNQPLINSASPGRMDLCLRIREGALEVLVGIRHEPGLTGGAMLFPTLVRYPGQQTPSALEKAIDGLSGASVLLETTENDEGGRFYLDLSAYRLLLVPEDTRFGENFAWVSVSELKFLLARSNTCTIQLRCIASMLLGLL